MEGVAGYEEFAGVFIADFVFDSDCCVGEFCGAAGDFQEVVVSAGAFVFAVDFRAGDPDGDFF